MEEINKKDPNGPEKTSKIETARSNNVDNNRKLKVTVIVLAVIAAVLALVFAYVWYDRQQMINDLTVDKENLTNELIELQGEYSQLSTDNDSLNVQLDREKEKVQAVRERARNPSLHHEALHIPDRFAQHSEYRSPQGCRTGPNGGAEVP